MKDLIENGNFVTQQLSPWTATDIDVPEFTPYQSNGYSLLLPPRAYIQQSFDMTGNPLDCTFDWTISACIDAKAHMGVWLLILISAVTDHETLIDSSLANLTTEFQTLSYSGRKRFTPQHRGFAISVVSSNAVGLTGPANAPIQVADIKLTARFLKP